MATVNEIWRVRNQVVFQQQRTSVCGIVGDAVCSWDNIQLTRRNWEIAMGWNLPQFCLSNSLQENIDRFFVAVS